MKITVIEPSGRLYGSEFCLLDIIRATAGQAYKWEVVLPAGGGFGDILGEEGVLCRYLLPPAIHTRPRIGKLWSYWRIRRFLSEARPDVVYINQAGMLRAVNLITRGMRLPIVCQVQTLEDARFISRFPREHDGVQAFICNSRFIAAEAAVPSGKLCIFYQGVENASIATGPTQPGDGEPWRIGILGRIARSKGHYVMLEAAKRLAARGRIDLRFVVIGDGLTPADTEEFSKAVRDEGVAERFEMRGYRQNVAEELAGLHLLLIPSLAEPLGRVLLDACAAGLPAIVSDSGGLGEFSRHFGIGKPVPAGDPESLAVAIEDSTRDFEAGVQAFRKAADSTLRRLGMREYARAVAEVMCNAASGKDSAIEWLGTAE